MQGIPRKLSVSPGHPDCHPSAVADDRTLIVYLDDEEQAHVVAYDLDAGTISRHLVSTEGKLLVDPDEGTMMTETVPGRVGGRASFSKTASSLNIQVRGSFPEHPEVRAAKAR